MAATLKTLESGHKFSTITVAQSLNLKARDNFHLANAAEQARLQCSRMCFFLEKTLLQDDGTVPQLFLAFTRF